MKPAPNPTTVGQLIQYGAAAFEEAHLWFGHGSDNAFDEAAELVFFAAGLKHEDADEAYPRALTDAQRDAALRFFERRIRERIPAAYLTRRMWFAGHEFYVDERVLVPRSPLAEVIDARFEPWIDPAAVHRVLDIGTGSGCIAIASALALPEVEVDAADTSTEALAVAAVNVERFNVGSRVRLVQADVFEGLAERRYDIIISNPPYVGDAEMAELPEEYRCEPQSGLSRRRRWPGYRPQDSCGRREAPAPARRADRRSRQFRGGAERRLSARALCVARVRARRGRGLRPDRRATC